MVWTVPDTPKKSGKPVRLDYKQAKELERRNLSQFRGLTSGGRNMKTALFLSVALMGVNTEEM